MKSGESYRQRRTMSRWGGPKAANKSFTTEDTEDTENAKEALKLGRGEQAGDGAVAAKGEHHFEEAWCDGLAGEGDAGAVDQRAGFHLFFFGQRAQHLLGGLLGELRGAGRAVSAIERGVTVGEFAQRLADGIFF